jgi:hypothetical protein
MHTTNSKSPQNESWRELCQTAVLEFDSTKLPLRIVEAEAAIVRRLHELPGEAGDHIEEQEALDDAAYALRALRSTPRSAIN